MDHTSVVLDANYKKHLVCLIFVVIRCYENILALKISLFPVSVFLYSSHKWIVLLVTWPVKG